MAQKTVQDTPHATLTGLEAETTTRRRALALHKARPAPPLDLAAVEHHRIERIRLEGLVADAQAAVEFQRGVVQLAEAAAAQASIKELRATLEREARDGGQKRVRQIVMRARMLVPDLEWLEGHRQRVDAFNAEHGREFGFIRDAEFLERGTPAHTVPPRYQKCEAWVDEHGRQPAEYRPQRDGTALDMEGKPLTRRLVDVLLAGETFVGDHMPTRLGDAIQLSDLDGGRIWPPIIPFKAGYSG